MTQTFLSKPLPRPRWNKLLKHPIYYEFQIRSKSEKTMLEVGLQLFEEQFHRQMTADLEKTPNSFKDRRREAWLRKYQKFVDLSKRLRHTKGKQQTICK